MANEVQQGYVPDQKAVSKNLVDAVSLVYQGVYKLNIARVGDIGNCASFIL